MNIKDLFKEINTKIHSDIPPISFTGIEMKIHLKYPDVTPKSTYYQAILWANNEGIIFGYPDGYFKPNNWMRHGEFIAVLSRYKYAILRNKLFREHWTTPYYEYAEKNGWLEEKNYNLIKRNLPIAWSEIYNLLSSIYPNITIPKIENPVDSLKATRQEIIQLFYDLASLFPSTRKVD